MMRVFSGRQATATACPTAAGYAPVRGTVHDIGYLGDWTTYHIDADGLRLKAAVANAARIVERPITWGDAVTLAVAPDSLL